MQSKQLRLNEKNKNKFLDNLMVNGAYQEMVNERYVARPYHFRLIKSYSIN